MAGLMKTTIKSLPFLHSGKVRDIYAVGDDKMLVVQTDRLSAFDVITHLNPLDKEALKRIQIGRAHV